MNTRGVAYAEPPNPGYKQDLTFEIGTALAAVIYLTWRPVADRSARAAK